jgi:hypothetical protein
MNDLVRRHRPSAGTVLGAIAIVIALGSSAYAITLGRNAVKSKNIASKAVKSRHIARDAVKGVQVKESTLGKVPSAASADNAAGAANAELLDGFDSSALERTGEVVYGIASPLVASAEFFSIPEMGLRVESDGDSSTGDDEVVLRNTSTSRTIKVLLPTSENFLNPGNTATYTAPIPAGATQQVVLMVQDATAGDPSAAQRRLLLHCYFYVGSPNDCVGTRLTP